MGEVVRVFLLRDGDVGGLAGGDWRGGLMLGDLDELPGDLYLHVLVPISDGVGPISVDRRNRAGMPVSQTLPLRSHMGANLQC